jgi:hypothetical protein
MRRFRWRLLTVLLPLTILAVLIAAGTRWLDQQGASARRARHLGGASTFNIEASPVNRVADDRAEVHTIER